MLRFEPGNVVRLVSGGPLMTVQDVHIIREVDAGFITDTECVWFDTYNVAHKQTFNTCMLDGPGLER